MKNFTWLLLTFYMSAMSQNLLEKGEKCFHQKDYKQAKIHFENVLTKNPSDLKALEYLGDIEANSAKWDSATYFYEKLKQLKPREANYQYKYGGALGMFAKDCNKFRALAMIPEIRTSFEKAIALDPQHIEARWALIELYLQLPGVIGGSEKKANQYADELMKISTVDGWLAKGHIAEYFNRNPTAEKCYKKAIEISGSKTSYSKLAALYKTKMNLPEKARATMAAFSEKNKS